MLFIVLLLVCTCADNVEYSTICELQGWVEVAGRTQCSYTITMMNHAHVTLNCNQTMVSGIYTCDLDVKHRKKFSLTQHMYQLSQGKSLATLQLMGNDNQIRTEVTTQLNWHYKLWLQGEFGQIAVKGTYSQYHHFVIVVFAVYTLLGLAVLPLGRVFYDYMLGVPAFSMIVSLQLTFTLFMIALIAEVQYLLAAHESGSSTIIGIIILSLCLVFFAVHLFSKLRTYIRILLTYKTSVYILGAVSFLYFFLTIALFSYSHKNWLTYSYYAFALIFYMLHLFVRKTYKKYRFSFRLVMFDSLSIIALALTNQYYPCLNYQIPTYHQLVSVFLMVGFLFLTAFLIFIWVKVIKGDLESEQFKPRRLKRNPEQQLPVKKTHKLHGETMHEQKHESQNYIDSNQFECQESL